jgi:hypothetical protein
MEYIEKESGRAAQYLVYQIDNLIQSVLFLIIVYTRDTIFPPYAFTFTSDYNID